MTLRWAEAATVTQQELEAALDAPALLSALYPHFLRPPVAAEAAASWLRSPEDAQGWQLVLRHPETGALIGGIRLECQALSYFVARPHWGQGHGTRMLQWVVEQRLDSAGRQWAWALTEHGNVASRRLLARAGFHFAGLVRPEGSARALLRHARLGGR